MPKPILPEQLPMQDANVRLIQGGNCLRFLLETLAQSGVIGKMGWKEILTATMRSRRVSRA